LHPDRSGTFSQITSPAPGSVAKREYDAFGNKLRDVSGSTPTPWGFAGGWGYCDDAESGIVQVGHRYYDPSLGRFLTRDPAEWAVRRD
jgi:RHS repeat-associated protein